MINSQLTAIHGCFRTSPIFSRASGSVFNRCLIKSLARHTYNISTQLTIDIISKHSYPLKKHFSTLLQEKCTVLVVFSSSYLGIWGLPLYYKMVGIHTTCTVSITYIVKFCFCVCVGGVCVCVGGVCVCWCCVRVDGV